MQKKRPWLSLVIAGAAASAALWASAAGMGGGASGAVLGQALDYAVQVRLSPGETLTPECVGADVTVGDRHLLPHQVRTLLDAQVAELVRIHVQTLQAIDEPVVDVELSVGCSSSRFTRRYIVLADPPPAAASPAVMAPAYALSLPDAGAMTAPAGPAPANASVAVAAAAPVTPAATPPPHAAPPEPTTVSVPVSMRAAARAEPRPEPRAATATLRALPAKRTRHAPTATAAPVPASRLKLEAVEPPPVAGAGAVEQAMQAVAEAASAAQAAASAASAASERIASLERTVEQLRSQAKSGSELTPLLRERLAQAERSSRWVWPLLTGFLALAGLVSWLAWRLAAAQRDRQQVWQRAAVAPERQQNSELTTSRLPTAPIPFVTSEIRMPDSAALRQRNLQNLEPPTTTAHWVPTAQVMPAATGPTRAEQARERAVEVTMPLLPEPPMERTEVLPPYGSGEGAPARDVSIDELIDLEQQAEFFVVLGQDEAAVDLLVEHLRQTGGGSPLPYLKLLEIHHRRGERTPYERMRARFNHRFNAYAPDWGADLQEGRTLEDYSGVIPRLQQVWSRPLDAMAELEALLFRKSRGELFDLPAYREVLFLYALARDLLDRESADTGAVDLLLPLASGGEFSSTSPAPLRDSHAAAMSEMQALEDRPTAPVDLDLSSEVDPPTSIFDPLEETPARLR